MDIYQSLSNVQNDWKDILESLIQPYVNNINKVLSKEKNEGFNILPETDNIFNAFKYCSYDDLKVVIIGQDCYYSRAKNGSILANGLCFSVNPECHKCPPSLKTIFDELYYEYGEHRTCIDLTDWALQGVLLLNCALTVREGKAGSHMKVWRSFTEDIIKHITVHHDNVVYMLWGEFAKSYKAHINVERNLVLECRHPSGLAASKGPFVGNNHFSLANAYLTDNQKDTVKWI